MHRRLPPYLSVLLLLLAGSVLVAAEVTTMAGATHKAEILTLSHQEVSFKAEGKLQTLKAADLLSVDFSPATASFPKEGYVRVQLRDGSGLIATSFTGQGDKAVLKLAGEITVSVPWLALQHVLFQANNPDHAETFETLLADKSKQDVLRLLSRDEQSINTFQGTVGQPDATGKTLAFQTSDGRQTNLQWDRLRGMIFARPPLTAPAAVGKVFDTGGNIYAAVTLALENYDVPLFGAATVLRLRTPAGLEVQLPLSSVLRCDFSLGKVAYLSDLEPLRVDKASMLEEIHPGYKRNQNLLGRPLSLGGKTYTKGLATRSRTVLEYDVTGYNLFQALIGIDDDMAGPAHAIVRIEGDGRELFSLPVTRRDVKPKEIELRITGIKKLRLVVDFGEDYDLGDHVDFANARIVK